MKYCNAYQFISFLVAEIEKNKDYKTSKENISIDALKINNLSSELWEKDIDCDFGYYAFKQVEGENARL